MYCTVCSQEEITLNGTLRKSCCLPSSDLEVTRKHGLEIGKFLTVSFCTEIKLSKTDPRIFINRHHQMSWF